MKQLNDRIISPIFEAVSSQNRPSFKDQKSMCRKSKVILYYWQYLKINSQGILVKQINTTEQIVLPLKYRHIVYKELHENMDHLGRERVIELCRQRFHWPGYEKDITHYIRKKCKCVKDKNPNKQQTAPFQSIITHEPFELVTIDCLHLDRSKGGYEYLLYVVDHFSKLVQLKHFKPKISLGKLLLIYCLINIFSILDFRNVFPMTKESNSTINYLNGYLKLPALNHSKQPRTTIWEMDCVKE